jgi:hypothetical protein
VSIDCFQTIICCLNSCSLSKGSWEKITTKAKNKKSEKDESHSNIALLMSPIVTITWKKMSRQKKISESLGKYFIWKLFLQKIYNNKSF